MGKIVVNTNVTLDGVMQAPAGPDEDPRGGFEHGGWATPYFDRVMAEQAGQGIAQGGAFLFGRRTYEHFASVWPNQPDDDVFAKVLNGRMKYVASRTLAEPLVWRNSTLLKGDAAEAVAGLKLQQDKDLVILGSGELIRSLMPHGLIDEYPTADPPARPRFGPPSVHRRRDLATLRLVDTTTTTTGVVIATYVPGEPPTPQPA